MGGGGVLVHEQLGEAEAGVEDVDAVETADDGVAAEGEGDEGDDAERSAVVEEDERVADPEADREPQESREHAAEDRVVREGRAGAAFAARGGAVAPVRDLVVDVVQGDGAEELGETVHLEELVGDGLELVEDFGVVSFVLLDLL